MAERVKLLKYTQILNKFHTEMANNEYIEKIVCKINDLQNNEMKVFEFGESGKILMVKQNNQFYALGTKCSHYGAPLVKGVLYNGYIRCPWHAACFNITSGDIEDFPGIDSLPKYDVSIVGNDVKVKAKIDDLTKNLRTKLMCQRNPKNNDTFVIVGGGAAGFQCAETLKQEGFPGRVVLVSQENSLPYDRTKLSKTLSIKVDDLILRPKEFLDKTNIEVILNTRVIGLDTNAKTIQLNDGSLLNYSKVFLGSGAEPRKLTVPGSSLENICYLRTHNDANFIAGNANDKNVVIIGTSFIGMEVAAFLHGKAKSISIVGRSDYPFVSLGNVIGKRIKELFDSKGIKFYGRCNVIEFRGTTQVQSAVLNNNEVLPCDMCVIGIGTTPNVEYLKNSNVTLDKNQIIIVDKNFKTSVNDVYAGGDTVKFPLPISDNALVNIGHWQTAQAHGKYAAMAMLDKPIQYKSVPFFWSMLFGKGLRFSGYSDGFDDIHISGNLEEFKFVAYYFVKDKTMAVATMNNDPIASMFSAVMREGKTLLKSDIIRDSEEWIRTVMNKS